MIDQITIKNFKSFKDVTLKLGPLNIFIGTNASGKSNFFDALRVLQGIGYGFTIHEILDGKPKSATSEVWEGIRGGSRGTPFASENSERPTLFQIGGNSGTGFSFVLEMGFWAKDGRLCCERLHVSQDVYDSCPLDNQSANSTLRVRCYKSKDGPSVDLEFERSQPVLTQMAYAGHPQQSRARPDRSEEIARTLTMKLGGNASLLARLQAGRVADLLANAQRIDPSPAVLRGYSQAYEIKRMGEHGENFAALVRMICNDPATKEAYLSWLRELRPHDVDDVGILKGAIGEPMLMMKERGREWPAPSLSDGTLRFAAIAAAFFQPDMPGILTIEEIENGIHASRLRLLVELIRSQAAVGKAQVMVTTHSPVVLAWLKPEEYATTFYCRRDEQTGESQIIPLAEIPRFQEIVSKQPISDLFAEGWLEEAL